MVKTTALPVRAGGSATPGAAGVAIRHAPRYFGLILFTHETPFRDWTMRTLLVIGLLVLAGCSRGPSRTAAPDWDPSGFADAILEKLDADGNGSVEIAELAAAPGLAAGQKYIDSNGDGALSRDELIARFERYVQMRIGLKDKRFRLTHNGKPLAGAEVKFVPEFFLEGLVEPATGTTDNMGAVQPGVAGETMALMRVGYYRVEVTSPQKDLPAKFNTETTLGVEVSPVSDDPSTDATIEIRLRDK